MNPFTEETHADREIASQPAIWRKAGAFAPSVAHLFPKRGHKVAFVGCGSSWFMSQAAAGIWESQGLGEADSYTCSEFIYSRNYDVIVAITRSGTTTETIELLAKTKTPTLVITAVAGSPVTEHATHSIVMDFADEKSVLQTVWATTVLGLIRHIAGESDLEKLAMDAEIALASDLGELVKMEQITFLGRGWTVGLANEGALKTRESSQFWAEAYPAMDYRHGPLSIAQPGRCVWVFGEIDDSLKVDIERTGALLEMSTLDPLAHLIRAQRTAIAIAKNRGMNPDYPRNLSRSIILN